MVEKSKLPIIDVEDERATNPETLEESEPKARRAGLRGVQQLAIHEAQQARESGHEAGVSRPMEMTKRNPSADGRPPDPLAEARTDHLHLKPRLQKLSQQQRAPCRVRRAVKTEERYFHRSSQQSAISFGCLVADR
jgi:hypothetical protein